MFYDPEKNDILDKDLFKKKSFRYGFLCCLQNKI